MGVKIIGSKFHRRSIESANREADKLREQLNRYEGANPNTPDRGWVPAFVRDARYDANSFTRWEMSRKIRYIRRNCWLLQRIEDEQKKWTVGPNGLQVIPDTSDPEFNKVMLESYHEWCESPCYDSTLTMPQVHRMMAAEHGVDGELFVNFTRTRSDVAWFDFPVSIPAVQLIESHRCSSPGMDYSMRETDDIVDGVQLGRDELNRPAKPIGYWVRDGFHGDAWSFKSTDVMHHVLDPHRIGMFRDITPYHTTMGTLEDLVELEMMEMQRAKQNAEVANILTNPAGEISAANAIRQRFGGNTNPTPPDDDANKRIEMYRRILGSRTIALKTGETLTQFDSKTPSASTQWYWRYKIGQVCSAAGVPLILIFPELIESMQGTVVRGIYDDAHEGFRAKFFLYAHAARKMYRYFANWARYNDPRCYDAPADWAKCHVIPPRAVNVDIGYNSAATLAEYNVGFTNFDDEAGKRGTTAEVLIRKKARNIAMIHRIAAEENVSAAELSAPIADTIKALAQANAASAPDEDDPNPKKKESVEV